MWISLKYIFKSFSSFFYLCTYRYTTIGGASTCAESYTDTFRRHGQLIHDQLETVYLPESRITSWHKSASTCTDFQVISHIACTKYAQMGDTKEQARLKVIDEKDL